MLREHLTTTRQIVVASRDLAQTDPLCVCPPPLAHRQPPGRPGPDRGRPGLGLAAARPGAARMAAGTLVEMPFENLSNGAALWVDVVWSKERPWAWGTALCGADE